MASETTLPRAARWYILLFSALALGLAGALVAASARPSARTLLLMGILAALLALAHRFPVVYAASQHLCLDLTVLLAAVLLLDPGQAVLVGFAGPLLLAAWSPRDWTQIWFNACEKAVQCGVGGLVLGAVPWWRPEQSFATTAFLPATLLAGLAMHAANTVAVPGLVAAHGGDRFRRLWRESAVGLDPVERLAMLSQVVLGILVAVLATVHVWAPLLLLIPGRFFATALGSHAALRLRAEERIVHLAFTDQLTGVANRARFYERLAEADRRGASGAVLFLDLDDFKAINDTHGHAAGDATLVQVAARLAAAAGPGALVARLGGDEFTVLAEGATPAGAEALAARIRATLAAPVSADGIPIAVSASVGIAHLEPRRTSPADLMREADAALYRAKAGKPARYAPRAVATGEAIG